MRSFAVELRDASRRQRLDDIVSFVGEDASGSFGLLAGHQRFMTVLRFGLARLRNHNGDHQYLALPGGVVDFRDDQLTVVARHFLLDDDYARISQRLRDTLIAEEEQLRVTRDSLRRMEEDMLRRLWELGRAGVSLQ